MSSALEPDRRAEGLQAKPEVAAALHAVLTASRPERFKRLTVACQNDHVLARVYQTAVGLVLTHATEGVKREKTADLPGYGAVTLPPVRGPRAEVNAYLLIEGVFDEVWPMQCRCSTAEPRAGELLDAIRAGRKRLRVSHTA